MTDTFYEVLPTYMAMGMTPEEFWNGDPYLTVIYRRAWELKKEQKNDEMWWQGFYIYEAIAVVAKNLTRKKGERTVNYPEKPHELTPQTEERKAEKKKQARKEAIDYLNGLKKRLDAKYGR